MEKIEIKTTIFREDGYELKVYSDVAHAELTFPSYEFKTCTVVVADISKLNDFLAASVGHRRG